MAYGTLAIDTIQSSTTGTPTQFNDGSGTQIGTLCRAWVNFNSSSGSSCVVRASFNVSSVTYNATGDYTVNFTNAMPDINYSTNLSGNGAYGVDRSAHPSLYENISAATESAPTTTSCKVGFANNGGSAGQDLKYICVSVFR